MPGESPKASPRKVTFTSLNRRETAVALTRFDIMSKEEFEEYIQTPTASSNAEQQMVRNADERLQATDETSPSSGMSIQTLPRTSTNRDPLFPPSPPSSDILSKMDHPLRILAKAVYELQEALLEVRQENNALRIELERMRASRIPDDVDKISLRNDINEALSTSLQTPSVVTPARALPISSPSPISTLASLPIRESTSEQSTSKTMPSSNTSVRSLDVSTPASRRRDTRTSWTASLWGWGGSKRPPSSHNARKGSVGSFASEERPGGDETAVVDTAAGEEEDETWRNGPGGSCPAYRAIFLATRILTPDPASILTPNSIDTTSLIARLAHGLITTARDQGITIKEPLSRRRSSRENRSRAVSIVSQHSSLMSTGSETPSKDPSYGDALAATATYGKSLLSTISTATIRGARQMTYGTDTPSRPALLNRASSSKLFPTTAVAAMPTTAGSISSALPSVELSSIVAAGDQAPTVLLSRQNLTSFFSHGKGPSNVQTATRFNGGDPPLIDRYGFIYDLQHAKMLKDADAAGIAGPAALNGIMPTGQESEEVTNIGSSSPSPSTSHHDVLPEGITPPLTPSTVRTPSRENVISKRTRPSSAIFDSIASPSQPLTAKESLTVISRGASSLKSSVNGQLRSQPSHATLRARSKASRATVSSLLDRLTTLHDQQQNERKAEWDKWLKKHRLKVRGTESSGETGGGWSTDMIGISQMGLSKNAEEWKAFAKLVRRGIPVAYRADVWAECCGAKDALIPGEYQEILTVHADDKSPMTDDIEKDVGRTLPGNMFFGGDGPGVAKLKRVLLAYAWRNPAVGYCQGMNMLAATLLLSYNDEEQAFWVLVAVIDTLLPRDFFSPSLLASRVDQLVLAELVAQYLPTLSKHLSDLGVDLSTLTFGWFLSLFTDCLPVETLFRVWDVFFVEGHDTLFRVAMAILKINESEIIACETTSDLFAFMSGMPSRLWAADKLIMSQHNYRPFLSHTDLAAKYTRHLKDLR